MHSCLVDWSRALFGTAVCLALVSCGGDDSKSFAQVRDCLAENPPAGYEVSDARADLDLISERAGLGGVAVNSDAQEIQVSVERSGDDAQETSDAYGAFDLGDVETYGNVVVASNQSPSEDEQSFIRRCVE